jgi:GT2 family glycosyltransferase
MPLASEPARVAVCLVTHNAASDLAAWWETLLAQDLPGIEIVAVDCASDDRSAERLAGLAGLQIQVLALSENAGFAAGMNLAIARCAAPWILSLNADTRPAPDFVRRLLGRAEMPSPHRIAAVTGRLGRFPQPGGGNILDACGMRLALAWRHLDRGSEEEDRGQFPFCERVFGATGAATLFRRRALEDVAIDGEIFDAVFHSFREDAELCFRLRERGWEILYEPAARCGHRRANLPARRGAMPPAVNYHSLKNRYLLRAYHATWASLPLTVVPALWRDCLALGHALLRERGSLPAYTWLWRNRRAIRERRRRIQARRTASAWSLARWFLDEARPL